MRIIYLIVFTLFFTLGGFCSRSPDAPQGGDGEEAGGPDSQQPPASINSPTGEEQKERICQFKTDHLVSIGTFSGSHITLEGKENPAKIPELIDLGFFVHIGFGDFSKKQLAPEEGGGLVLPYEYTGDEYADWCPNEGKCFVEVVYRGVDENAIYKKEKTHPRAPGGYYVYNGNLTIQILFSGQVLDFSGCN